MHETYLLSFLVLLVYFFVSSDTSDLAAMLVLRLQVFVLNRYLFVRSYWIYRKISKELKVAGFDPPPFYFVPIQHRDS